MLEGWEKFKDRVSGGIVLTVCLTACSSNASSLQSAVPQVPLAQPQQKDSIWQVVTSPNAPLDSVGLYDDQLNGVSATSPNDVWAVGRSCCTPHGTAEYYSSLLVHWDGSAWKLVPGASKEPPDVQLFAVSAIAPNDAWAFGESIHPNAVLIEHWNGSKWSIVSSPGGFDNSELLAASAISSKNIWAAGEANFQPLVEHWNGSAWSVVPNIAKGGGLALLNGIAASSSNDIMAVGAYSSPNANLLAEHWNGSSWTDVSPKTSTIRSFAGVAAVGANHYWAVGWQNGNGEPPQTLAEQWSGSKFTEVTTPNDEPKTGSPLTNQLWSVAAQSPTDVWALGLWTYFPGAGTPRSLFEHWNGKKWTIETGPSSLESSNNSATNELLSIGRASSKQFWAVGNQTIPPNCCEETLTVQTIHG
jgi:hypothetical protein